MTADNHLPLNPETGSDYAKAGFSLGLISGKSKADLCGTVRRNVERGDCRGGGLESARGKPRPNVTLAAVSEKEKGSGPIAAGTFSIVSAFRLSQTR